MIRQNTAISQDKVFPQTGHVRCVEQGHIGLLWRAAAFTVVASAAGGDDVHPSVDAVLSEGDDVFACQFLFMKMIAAIRTDVTVSGEEFAIGQPRLHLKRVDLGHTTGADDAVHGDDGLHARDGIVPTVVNSHLPTRLPADVFAGIVNHRFFQRYPRLG